MMTCALKMRVSVLLYEVGMACVDTRQSAVGRE